MIASARVGIRKNTVSLPSFTDNFNRSDRNLDGDNGWVYTGNGGGVISIVSGMAVVTSAPSGGFPGSSSGSFSQGASHEGSTANLFDLSFDLTAPAGAVSFQVTIASARTAGSINTGVVFRASTNGGATWIVQRIVATNNVDNGNFPGSTPDLKSRTTRIRFTLDRATGTVNAYFDGVLNFTYTGYTGLTGSEFWVGAPGATDPSYDNISVA